MSMKTAVRQLSRWIRQAIMQSLSAATAMSISVKHILFSAAAFEKGDILVIQNEINNLHLIIEKAKAAGLIIVFNPSPYNHVIETLPMDKIDYLFINEVEGRQAERF